MKKYYKNELSKVKFNITRFSVTIKVFANGNGNDTRYLDLNKESAEVLIEWLQDNFLKNKNFHTD